MLQRHGGEEVARRYKVKDGVIAQGSTSLVSMAEDSRSGLRCASTRRRSIFKVFDLTAALTISPLVMNKVFVYICPTFTFYVCRVALKTVQKTPNLLLSIAMETRVHETLSHPNLVFLLHKYEDAHQVTFVLPYMGGGDLLDAIPPEEGLSLDAAMAYSRQLLASIVYLHGNGLAHRYISFLWCTKLA